MQLLIEVLSYSVLLPSIFTLARGRSKKYPEGYVIDEIRERKESGESLDSRFIPLYLRMLVYQRYESWNQALEAAGLDPTEESSDVEHIEEVLKRLGFDPEEIKYSERRIEWPEGTVKKVLRCRKERGEVLKRSALPVFVNGLIQYRYESWEDAIKEAGFDPKEEYIRNISKWDASKESKIRNNHEPNPACSSSQAGFYFRNKATLFDRDNASGSAKFLNSVH